jgi:hypothetical protein
MTKAMSVAALALAGCAASPTVTARDPGYLRNKSLRIAVLDVCDRSGAVEPGAFQAQLAQRCRALGWSRAEAHAVRGAAGEWSPERAAAAARARGAEAALVAAVAPAAGGAAPRRAEEDASVWSEASGRRAYYRRDLEGEGARGPRVRAGVSLVDARSGAVVYRAEFEADRGDVSEEGLAAVLLGPLED